MESLKQVQVTHRKARGIKPRTRNRGNKRKTNKKWLDFSSNTSGITSRVHGLNMPTSRQKLADWIFFFFNDPMTCCLQEIYFKFSGISRLTKDEKKTHHFVYEKGLRYIHKMYMYEQVIDDYKNH